MQTMPETSQPSNQAPASSGSPRAERGLAQLVVTSLLVVLAFSAGWFGNAYVNKDNYISSQNVDQLVLNQAWDTINSNFYNPNLNKQQLAYAAINGMIQSLNDPGHTRLDTPSDFQSETGTLNNNCTVGIGIELSGGGSDPITILAVFPGTPAANAGLQAGDQIVGVNGADVRGMTLDQVTPLIRGKVNTSLTLTILRPTTGSPSATTSSTPTVTPTGTPTAGPGQTISVSLTRVCYVAPTGVYYVIPEVNIAVIQLINFSGDADMQLRKALLEVEKQKVKGIIFDLRGNGGGDLSSAVSVASEFIPAGQNSNVLITRSRDGQNTTYAVQPGGAATSIPLVILIDHDTASAAEITAGAIALNRPDVKTVGESTYGTGTVLLPYTLADGSVLELGIALWLLPNGQSVYHKGLAPEQQVALPNGLTPLTVLSAPNNTASYPYIQAYGDTQLLQAIKDLDPAAGS